MEHCIFSCFFVNKFLGFCGFWFVGLFFFLLVGWFFKLKVQKISLFKYKAVLFVFHFY